MNIYDTRDDTLPRPSDIIGHFKRNLRIDVLDKVRQAFKKSWGAPIKIKSPLEFRVEVKFGAVLPDDIVKDVQKELADHDWKTYTLATQKRMEGSAQDPELEHVLVVKIDPKEAEQYAVTLRS